MTLQAILTLATAVFALAIKPGAGMMMVMSRSISHGLIGCFAFLIGFNLALLGYLSLVLGGLNLVDVDLLFISILIKSLAAVYLIWVGVKGLQTNGQAMTLEEEETQTFVDNVTSAFMLTLSNPLVILFYAGILPTILGTTQISWDNAMIIASIVVGVETLVVLAYCLPLIFLRKKMPQNVMEHIRVFSSLVLIIVGLYIGYTAIPAKDLLAVF